MARVKGANEGAKSTSRREHVPACFFQQTSRTEPRGTNPTPLPVDPEREPRWNPEQRPNPNGAETKAEAKLYGVASFKLNDDDGLSNQAPGRDQGMAPKTIRARELTRPQPRGPPARGVKRARSTRGRHASNDLEHEDPDPVPRRSEEYALLISDESAIKAFYKVQFKELNIKPLRQIVTAWVKRLAPERNNSFGRYNKRITPALNPGCRCPP